MTKAKSAIDKLAKLPPFDPTSTSVDPPDPDSSRFHIEEFQPAAAALVSQPGELGFYPNQDLCLSLQSFQNPGMVQGQGSGTAAMFPVGFESGGGGSWAAEAEMGHFSRLLGWNGGGYGGGERQETLHSSFHHPQTSIRAWDDLPMGADHHHPIPKLELQQQTATEGFMGFSVPVQMHGGSGGQDLHGINLAYHHQNHNSTSSMSTDSSR